MQLTAVERTNLVEQVEQRLLDLIRENQLSAGDRLPAELELTQRLGVSRTIVREALSRLRMLGLLESRKKRGIVVAEPDVFGGCKQVLDIAFLTEPTQRDLFEMRLTLEMGVADLLFLRKTERDLEDLEAIVGREEKASSERGRLKLEIEFHTRLYRIGRNPLLLRFRSLLEPFFREAVQREGQGRRRAASASHRDLFEELRSGTVESFRRKMREHLQPHFDRLAEPQEMENTS